MTINPITPFPYPAIDTLADGTTGTGLDFAVRMVGQDFGLAWRLTGSDIAAGAAAADGINTLIVQAIRATGAANDGEITTSDVYAISESIRSTSYAAFSAFHGNDEGSVETGFHLVQSDGAYTRLFGQNAIDTVLDGLYHIGFQIVDGRFQNEDGNANASVIDVAFWLNALLTPDLDSGSLANNSVEPDFQGSTGTGLDALVDQITGDHGLNARLSRDAINAGAAAANDMNVMIVEAIRATGVADDGDLSTQDMYDLNAWLRANRLDAFTAAHGDDEGNIETGFHIVQGDGSSTYLFGERAIDTIADGLYHMAFDIQWGRFANEDGNTNARLADVADWLTNLLRDDIDAGRLDSGRAPVDPSRFAADLAFQRAAATVSNGSSGFFDAGSQSAFRQEKGTFSLGFNADAPDNGAYQVLFSRDGASNLAGDLTVFIYQGQLGVYMQDGKGGGSWMIVPDVVIEAGRDYDLAITFGGMTGLSVYLNGERVATDHDFRLGLDGNGRGLVIGGGTWGRDTNNPTSVGNIFDGTITDFRLYDRVLNGFEIRGLSDAAPLDAPAAGAPSATGDLPAVHRGTGLTADVYDRAGNFSSVSDLIAQVVTQASPNATFQASRVDFGAQGMEATLGEFVGDAGTIGTGASTPMSTVGMHLTGFIWLDAGTHLVTVQSDDGFLLRLGGETISAYAGSRGFEGTSQQITVTGGLYQIELFYFNNGYDQGLRLMVDGEIPGPEKFWQSVEDFEAALAENGPMPEGGIGPDPDAPHGTTGTGLDQIIDIIMADEGLANEVSGADRAEAVAAADLINGLIVEAMNATRAAADGVLTTAEVANMSAWIRDHRYAMFLGAHGNDEDGVETGYHLIQNDGATTILFSDNAVNTVFDSIYHIGFEIFGDRFVNEDGNANARVEDVAWWLSAFLAEELGNTGTGQGGNTGESVGAKGSADAPDVVSVRAPVTTLASGALQLSLGDGSWHGFGNGLGNRILGNTLDNVLGGRAGRDTLVGGRGNDTLVGGNAADSMEGGRGDDTYEVDDAGDVGVEEPGGGIDTVLLIGGATTWTLADNFENLTVHNFDVSEVSGNALDNSIETDRGGNDLFGRAGNDFLSSGARADRLFGGDGNDTLDGGASRDRMVGEDGNDSYLVNHRKDVVVERAQGGTDTVHASVSFTLGDGVEHLVLVGMRGLTGRGNDGANSITGTEHDDVIDGQAGVDRMAGGGGNDVYFVSDAADRVVEGVDQGTDEIRAWVSASLSANVENGVLIGTANSNLTGNLGDNVLLGNDGANLLVGGRGDDTLRGGDGRDTLDGGVGRDVLAGGLGADRFVILDGQSQADEPDTIRDFLRSENDIIDLSGIDAVRGGSDDAFRVVTALSGAAGQLLITATTGGWQLRGDVDGDGNADFALIVQTTGAFGAADLLL